LLFEQSAVHEDVVDVVEVENFDGEIPGIIGLMFFGLDEFGVGFSFALLHDCIGEGEVQALFGLH
jgi:hypothetical protein